VAQVFRWQAENHSKKGLFMSRSSANTNEKETFHDGALTVLCIIVVMFASGH
jgi:hypothetical protein